MEITPTILLFLAAICSTSAFSKYGRTCKDIGCLPSETCAMAEDSCSYYQERNKECGQYPTCKKTGSVNNSPDPHANHHHDTPDDTVPRRPYSPPPATNTGGSNVPGFNPNPAGSNGYPGYNPSSGNRGSVYPSLPNGNIDPTPSRGGGYPSVPSSNDPYPNRGGSYDPYNGNRGGDPYNGNQGGDPYGHRDRDDDKNKGSSGDSGSTLSGLLNFLRGGGGSSTRYGSGEVGTGAGGLSYGDIFNALSGSNRNGFGSGGGGGSSGGSSFGGASPGGGSLSDIFFGRNGNRDSPSGGSSNNNYDRNYDDRRQQPAPSSGGSSSNGGFLSSLPSIFGNRGSSSGGGGSDLINSLRYGGLFNENNGHATNSDKPKVTVTGAGPGGYPTQAPCRPPNNQNVPNHNSAAQQVAPSSQSSQQPPGQKPAYGWTV